MTGVRRCLFLAVLVLVMPRGASAQGGLIDFFESLSGPGPFRGGGFTLRIACMKTASDSFRGSPRSSQRWETDFSCLNDHDFEAVEDPQGRLIAREPKNIRQVLELRGLWASTPQGERPVLLADPADERNVDLFKLDMVAAYRIAPFLDVGGGGGLIRFKVAEGPEGPATTVYRPVIVPISITFTPMAVYDPTTRIDANTKLTELTPGSKARRVARIRLDVNYIPFGFTGASWGKDNISTAAYSTDGNWVLSGGLILDFGSLVALGR